MDLTKLQRAERDELLAACKALVRGIDDHGVTVKVEPDVFDSYVMQAEAAIARCEKGGQP